jgi:ethanolamine utilization protein EutA (predicted chaperonin)
MANARSLLSVGIAVGTTTTVTFRSVNLLAEAAMNFGGRIVEIKHTTGLIRSIAEPA